jgi:soluble lytic murein transglycosylase-like protein
LLSGLCLPAGAHVYSYTDDRGTVNMSNVPTDTHYGLMDLVPIEAPAAVSAAPPGKLPPAIADKDQYGRMVDDVARAYGLESALLHAVISVESRYRPKIVSKKGAAGMMQLMPEITRRYGVADPFDPVQNVHGGARYLRDLLRSYNNDKNLALAAYNAGPHAVAKYGNRIPPYRETTSYVPKVLAFYRKYQSEGGMQAASQAGKGAAGRLHALPVQ